MTNAEKEAKLEKAFGKYNWSLGITERGGGYYITVFSPNRNVMGKVILSEHGGYHPSPDPTIDEAFKELFYELVDEALGTKPCPSP